MLKHMTMLAFFGSVMAVSSTFPSTNHGKYDNTLAQESHLTMAQLEPNWKKLNAYN